MGEGFAGSWGAKGMKNRNKTKMSKRKREEIRCFRGPRCRFGAFVFGWDVAVRSMHVFLLFCTEAAAQSTNTSCFLAFSPGDPTFLHVFFAVFAYQKRQNPSACVAAIYWKFFGILLRDLMFMCFLGCAGKRSFSLFGVISIAYKPGPPR